MMLVRVKRLLLTLNWFGGDCRAKALKLSPSLLGNITANVHLSLHRGKMTAENTTIKSRIKNLLRQPSIKLRRSKPANNKENLSNKVQYASLIYNVKHMGYSCEFISWMHHAWLWYSAWCVRCISSLHAYLTRRLLNALTYIVQMLGKYDAEILCMKHNVYTCGIHKHVFYKFDEGKNSMCVNSVVV